MSRSVRPTRSAIAMPSHDLSPEGVWYLYMVGPPPVASSTARAWTKTKIAGAHLDHEDARDRIALCRADEGHRAMLLEPRDVARPDLLGEAVDDLDAGQVALVDGAVEGLAGEGFLMDRAVGIAVEEAAELGLELTDATLRPGDEGPGEVLLVEPLAAVDRVHEMPLGGIAGRQRHVVAALHHAGAAAFAEQALDRDGDGEAGRGLLRMQRGEEPGAAGAEDQDVGGEALHCWERRGHGARTVL